MNASNSSNSTPVLDVASSPCSGTVDPLIVDWLSEIFGILGIISNLSFLFVTARVKSLQNATNYLLVSLCVSDLIYLTLHVTLRDQWIPVDQPIWKKIMCYKGTLTTGIFTTSILTILAISVERYVGICHPIMYKARGLGRPKKIVPMIICLWLFGVFFGFVYTLHCYFEPTSYNQKAAWWGTSIGVSLLYFISMFVNIVLYTFIVRLLHASTAKIENAKKVMRDRIQVVRLCIVTAAVFFACVFPRALYFAGYFHYLVTNDGKFVMMLWCWNGLSIILLMINSGVNPMIYNITCSRYRRAFGQAFGCLPPEVDRRRGMSCTSTYNRKFSEISRTCVTSASTNGNHFIDNKLDKVKLNPPNDNMIEPDGFDTTDNNEHFV